MLIWNNQIIWNSVNCGLSEFLNRYLNVPLFRPIFLGKCFEFCCVPPFQSWNRVMPHFLTKIGNPFMVGRHLYTKSNEMPEISMNFNLLSWFQIKFNLWLFWLTYDQWWTVFCSMESNKFLYGIRNYILYWSMKIGRISKALF
jgi:hypothetical protein